MFSEKLKGNPPSVFAGIVDVDAAGAAPQILSIRSSFRCDSILSPKESPIVVCEAIGIGSMLLELSKEPLSDNSETGRTDDLVVVFLGRILFGNASESSEEARRGSEGLEACVKPGGRDFGTSKPGGGCGLVDGVKFDGTKDLAVARISPKGFDS